MVIKPTSMLIRLSVTIDVVAVRKNCRAQAQPVVGFCCYRKLTKQRSRELMDYSALNQAVDNANQATNTNQWVLFTFVVIVPIAFALIMLFVGVPLAIAKQRKLKCPRCGNWKRNKSVLQTVRTVEGNKTIIKRERLVTCKKCKNEFAI